MRRASLDSQPGSRRTTAALDARAFVLVPSGLLLAVVLLALIVPLLGAT